MSSPAVPTASSSRLRLTLACAVVVIVGVVVAVNTVNNDRELIAQDSFEI